MGEILQARLQASGRRSMQLSSRPSPRALHLDPEFVNTPGAAATAAVAGAGGGAVEQSLETLLDSSGDGEASLTPLRAVPLTPGQLQAEVRDSNSPYKAVN